MTGNALLDTNIISEWKRPRPNPGVIAWLAGADQASTYISTITIAELRRGTERLPAGKRRDLLEDWLHKDLVLYFAGRILPVDSSVAHAWGKIMAKREAMGRSIHAMDAFIAATAEVHSLTLVTRNVADFQGSVRSIVNPWTTTD